ncbi:TIGR01777 family oxidoreductase [Methylococcus geothermalis]|uniref:TIGR01777 family protein n=1 Tax=Methylococcus geothermalis TaxID=2681310 RepID=A0A858Q4I2_9GAMM|nr:TIGR01777 family oxidoreductase [Methylococcus geothermalis]QJD28636.1 TIGR01777 family protein [Methylococcus geothermalis]
MQILVTGGTGFIGKSLCRHLLERGHRLTVLSRQAPDAVRRLCGEAVTPVASIDSLSPQAGFDAVVNLAGEPIADKRWTEARKRLLWESRVGLTSELVDYIARAETKPQVLVSGSAVGYYGNRGDTLLDEESTGGDDFSHRLCAAWEEAASQAAGHGVRVCVLRTGLVVGRNGGFLQRMLPLFRLGLGGQIGDGRQWMSWIHIDDHIAITAYLIGNARLEGAFNATAPHPVTNREFTDCLARLLNRPAPVPVPAFTLRLALGEMAELLLGGQRVIPKRLQQEPFRFSYEHLEDALRDALGR